MNIHELFSKCFQIRKFSKKIGFLNSFWRFIHFGIFLGSFRYIFRIFSGYFRNIFGIRCTQFFQVENISEKKKKKNTFHATFFLTTFFFYNVQIHLAVHKNQPSVDIIPMTFPKTNLNLGSLGL